MSTDFARKELHQYRNSVGGGSRHDGLMALNELRMMHMNFRAANNEVINEVLRTFK